MAAERFLRSNLKFGKEPSNTGHAQFLFEFLLDHLGDDSACPQAEVKAVLTRVFTANPAANLLFLFVGQLRHRAWMLAGVERFEPTGVGCTHPAINTGASQTIALDHRTGLFALANTANGHLANGFQRLMIVFASIYLHGRYYNKTESKCVA